MLKRTLFFALLISAPSALIAQTGSVTVSVPGSALVGSSGEASVGEATISGLGSAISSLDDLNQALSAPMIGDMMVSDPLSVAPSTVLLADGTREMPDLPVQEFCSDQSFGAVNATLTYETCITTETEAYDLIEAGIDLYEATLLSVCETSARLVGGSYVAMLDCLGPAPDN